MPRPTAQQIREKVLAYAPGPASMVNNVKALRGMAGVVRLRVADWRVIMDDDEVIEAVRVAPRGSTYDYEAHMSEADTVTIPRAEYEHLVAIAEDVADAEAIRQHRAAKAAGKALTISDEELGQILDGTSPLRVFHEARGLTQMQLEEASGLNWVQIANIESGHRRGSVDTLKRLAEALGMAVDALI